MAGPKGGLRSGPAANTIWSKAFQLLEGRSILAGRTARTLANIVDTLGCMAGPKGGLRSGPAANTIWSKAFQLLEVGLY